jgi:hypothetical protein
MNIRPESETILEDEMNLYNYWKVLVKRKKILLGIFIVPLVIITIVSLSLPRYYRGKCEISIPALPVSSVAPAMPTPNIVTLMSASDIVKLIGDIDESKKAKIFKNNAGAIKRASVSLPSKSTDKLNIIVDAETADIIPQAFKDIFVYISNIPEINEEIARIKEETDLKMKHLIEAKKANLIFLNQITEMMKKKELTYIDFNPADLIMKDGDLSLEIMNLHNAKVQEVRVGILAPPSITRQPTNVQIKQIIIITGVLSLFAGVFVVLFIEYIDRMKASEK